MKPVVETEYDEKFTLTYKDCSREYLRSTSTHGLRRVGWAWQKIARFIWAVLFAVAVVIYVIVMLLLLMDYLKYPTRTLVKKDLSFQTFPGVTVCNLNPIRITQIGYPDNLDDPIPSDTFYKFTIPSKYNGTAYGSVDPYLGDRTFFAKQVAHLNAFGERIPYGHLRKHFILHCAFDGRECDLEQDFIRVWSDVYGDCYTFSGGKADQRVEQERVVKEPGPLYGLRLILHTQSKLHLKSMTESNGVRLLVHPSTDMPFPEEGGLSVPAGYEASLNVAVEEHHYLSSPYGNCREPHVNKYGYHYSAVVGD